MILKVSILVLGILLGMSIQYMQDFKTITQAIQNEMQANGLEDQCKAMLSREDR